MSFTEMLDQGFFSDDADEMRKDIERNAASELALALETNKYLHKLIREITTRDYNETLSQEALSAFSLLRASEQYQSAIILCKAGSDVSAQATLRGLLETLFFIVMLRYDYPEFKKYIEIENIKSKKSMAKTIINTLEPSEEQIQKLQSILENKPTDKIKKNTIQDVAQSYPLSQLYLSYKQLSNNATHFTADSLSRHAKLDNERNWCGLEYGTGCNNQIRKNLLDAMKFIHFTMLAHMEILDESSPELSALIEKRAELEDKLLII